MVDILPKLKDPLPLLVIPVPNSKNVSVSTDDADDDKEGKFDGDCERSSFCVVHALGAVEEEVDDERAGVGGMDVDDGTNGFDGGDTGVELDANGDADGRSGPSFPPAATADALPGVPLDTDAFSIIDTTSATLLSKLSFLSGDGDVGRDAADDDADE